MHLELLRIRVQLINFAVVSQVVEYPGCDLGHLIAHIVRLLEAAHLRLLREIGQLFAGGRGRHRERHVLALELLGVFLDLFRRLESVRFVERIYVLHLESPRQRATCIDGRRLSFLHPLYRAYGKSRDLAQRLLSPPQCLAVHRHEHRQRLRGDHPKLSICFIRAGHVALLRRIRRDTRANRSPEPRQRPDSAPTASLWNTNLPRPCSGLQSPRVAKNWEGIGVERILLYTAS